MNKYEALMRLVQTHEDLSRSAYARASMNDEVEKSRHHKSQADAYGNILELMFEVQREFRKLEDDTNEVFGIVEYTMTVDAAKDPPEPSQ